jgi:hypothetical protein
MAQADRNVLTACLYDSQVSFTSINLTSCGRSHLGHSSKELCGFTSRSISPRPICSCGEVFWPHLRTQKVLFRLLWYKENSQNGRYSRGYEYSWRVSFGIPNSTRFPLLYGIKWVLRACVRDIQASRWGGGTPRVSAFVVVWCQLH